MCSLPLTFVAKVGDETSVLETTVTMIQSLKLCTIMRLVLLHVCVQRLLNDVEWVTSIPLFSVGSTESDDVTSVATGVAENVL